MSGRYVTSRRELASPAIPPGRRGFLGETGTEVTIRPLPVGYQETYSWRTNSRGEDDQDLVDARRIFRNGFRDSDPRFDRGHEFLTTRRTVEAAFPNTYVRWKDRSGNNWWYRGPFVCPMSTGASSDKNAEWVNPTALSDAEATLVGQRAILNTSPTSPQANAATFIGELFLGLPQMVGAALWKERLHDYRAIGSEYLNIQFGWIPFLNDLRKAAASLRDASAILTQLQRDNGRMVRRRFRFPVGVSSNYEELGNAYVPYRSAPTYVESPTPKVQLSKVTRTERELWFSGAFSYSLPVGDNLLDKFREYEAKTNVLLGTRVTPEVIWDLAPWSWLVDWKLGIGTALGSASMFSEDGLVIRYGYLMERNLTEVTYSQPSAVYSDFGDRVPATFLTLRSETKKRRRATPYGFGVDLGSLSDSKWAILAALGMTRGPRTLA